MKFLPLLVFIILFSTNVYALSWSNQEATYTSGIEYNTDRLYDFQITWNGDGNSVIGVLFELTDTVAGTSVNKTVSKALDVYYLEIESLIPSTYSYRWFAEDSASNTNVSNTFSYIIEKNTSSSINLYLNGTEGNKSYGKYSAANFTAVLNTPSKEINLKSNYDDMDVGNQSSVVYNEVNISYTGTYLLNASFDGDENYTPTWKAYYFDSISPQPSNMVTNPLDYATYAPNQSYQFNITWSDVSLSEVRFESNHTGKKKNYTIDTTPKVENSSETFWINLTEIFPAHFVYKWYAKDASDSWTASDERIYTLYKALALNLHSPFDVVLNGTTSVVNCYSITDQIDISDFTLYRNSTKISNTSYYERMDVSVLDVGFYEYECETDGNKNYSNQTLRTNLSVLTEYEYDDEVEEKKEFKIYNVSSVYVEIGKGAEGTFNLSSTLDELVNDFNFEIENLPSSWYSVSGFPSAILKGGYSIITISFEIPEGSRPEYIDLMLRVSAKTVNGSISATEIMPLSINDDEEPENTPPSYSSFEAFPSESGDSTLFSFVIEDDSDISGYIFSINDTGEWVNDTWIESDGYLESIDVMKEINLKLGTVAWIVYANDTNGIWSRSNENYMEFRSSSSINYTVPIIIVLAAGIVAVAIFFLKSKKHVPGKKVVYVYSRN